MNIDFFNEFVRARHRSKHNLGNFVCGKYSTSQDMTQIFDLLMCKFLDYGCYYEFHFIFIIIVVSMDLWNPDPRHRISLNLLTSLKRVCTLELKLMFYWRIAARHSTKLTMRNWSKNLPRLICQLTLFYDLNHICRIQLNSREVWKQRIGWFRCCIGRASWTDMVFVVHKWYR